MAACVRQVLDRELTLLAEMRCALYKLGCVPRHLKQLRVDSVTLQPGRKLAKDVLAYLDKRLVSSMGSIKDENGEYAIDYVPASENGAVMEAEPGSVWSDELESSLDDWISQRQECSFQEWHTDGKFGPTPPSCTVLHCVGRTARATATPPSPTASTATTSSHPTSAPSPIPPTPSTSAA